MIIAIDGPAAAGKGTLARRLAEHYGLAVLDTGLLYRAVGLGVARAGGDAVETQAAVRATRALRPADLEDPELRSDQAANLASKVGAIPEVREVLIDFQRGFALRPPGGARGAVLDGRDIGTRICPDADVKLFLTARVEVRAERRLKELRERGLEAIHGRVLDEMKARDARDEGRAVAPLEPAEDALVIDTSDLDPDALFARVLDFIGSRDRSGQA